MTHQHDSGNALGHSKSGQLSFELTEKLLRTPKTVLDRHPNEKIA